jgi:hypothetical protein
MTNLAVVTTDGDAAATRVERAAARAGLAPDLVERLPLDLSVLAEEGVFLNVDAQGFGLLDRRLDWRALGVALPNDTNLAFRPPRCGLLPDRYRLPLLRPAARAHAALHRYSYRFTLTETLFETPAYRWVPWRAFPAFEQEFAAAAAALDAAKTTVLDDYDAVRDEVVATVLRLATDSARRLEAAQGELARERQERVARDRVAQQELWAEEERIRRRLAAEDEERRREAEVKERLRTLKLEAARERMAAALSPLEEGARQLHAAVYEAASALRAALAQHGRLPGGSMRRARELTRWFRLMNWRSEPELEALLAELETLTVRRAGRARADAGALDAVLGDLIARCYADARALAEPHRMGALEL